MSRGKRGKYTQTGMYVKINNELHKRLSQLPKWNSNKNQTINDCISLGLDQAEKELTKQTQLDL